MKNLLIWCITLFTLNFYSQPAQIIFQDPDYLGGINMDLDWADEFNGTSLDQGIWNTAYPWGSRWLLGTHEQQYMKDNNVSVSGGTLKLEMKNDPGQYKINTWEPDNTVYTSNGASFTNLRNFTYTGGVVSTKKKFLYGYYEVRFKININSPPTNHVAGIWPGFWFRGDNKSSTGEFEIDACEIQTNCPNAFYGSLHITQPKSDYSIKRPLPFDYVNHFIKIGVLWTPNRVIWNYYDDVNDVTFFIPATSSRAFWTTDAPLNLLLSIAMGDVPINVGNQCNLETGPSPVTDQALPATMEIDYIRAYKFHDCDVPDFNFATTNINICNYNSNIDPHLEQGKEVVMANTNCNAHVFAGSGTVVYHAGEKVWLQNSFQALPGAELYIVVDGCGGATNRLGHVVDSLKHKGRIDENNILSGTNINNEKILVYPNPFTDRVDFITSDFSYDSIKVMDMLGNIVYNKTTSRNSIDLSFLPNGVYFITFQNNSETKTTKIVKNN